jgi:hypothetical protein
MKTYSLFSGRHELPENEGALFNSFDFVSFKGNKTELYNKAKEELRNEKEVSLIVTGLTPALTEFLSETKNLKGKLFLLHFNAETKTYVSVLF